MTGVFATSAPEYAACGLPVFPVDTRAKRPAVKGWQKAGPRATKAWAEKFPNADGVGLVMGQRTGLVEVDVDAVGDAPLARALERFGETPVTIRTASGKSKAWYRYSGEKRSIRVPGDMPVDVLGGGYTVAPPSYRADLGAAYHFLTGSLADLRDLPPITRGALSDNDNAPVAEAVADGTRNINLFMWCMTKARQCRDRDELIEAAITWARALPNPLDSSEVVKTAQSAWRYEQKGRNFVGLKRPQVTSRDEAMDDLKDESDAYFLLDLFYRYHSRRDEFAISPRSMSDAGDPPWHRTRIERARDVLVERGYLQVVERPDKARRRAGRYRLTDCAGIRAQSLYTPLSCSPAPA
jgi:hypothetical protein